MKKLSLLTVSVMLAFAVSAHDTFDYHVTFLNQTKHTLNFQPYDCRYVDEGDDCDVQKDTITVDPGSTSKKTLSYTSSSLHRTDARIKYSIINADNNTRWGSLDLTIGQGANAEILQMHTHDLEGDLHAYLDNDSGSDYDLTITRSS